MSKNAPWIIGLIVVVGGLLFFLPSDEEPPPQVEVIPGAGLSGVPDRGVPGDRRVGDQLKLETTEAVDGISDITPVGRELPKSLIDIGGMASSRQEKVVGLMVAGGLEEPEATEVWEEFQKQSKTLLFQGLSEKKSSTEVEVEWEVLVEAFGEQCQVRLGEAGTTRVFDFLRLN